VKAISSLLGYTDYSLYAPSCQKQADKSSCGVFALAFAVEVALRADPSTIVFVKESQMKDMGVICMNPFRFMRRIHADYYHAVMQSCHAHY
jgi:hypothetical protein